MLDNLCAECSEHFSKLRGYLDAMGIAYEIDSRSMKAQFKYANKLGVRRVAVIAGDELAKGVVKLRDMQSSEETEVARGEIVAKLAAECK